MDVRVKVAVIGGGPAGIACGVALQRQKIENCVIDKAVFPRDKTCAGLVTRKTLLLLEELLGRKGEELEGLFCDKVCDVSVLNGVEPLMRSACGTEFHLVDRLPFDAQLVQAYRQQGGTMLEGRQVSKIDYAGKRVQLSDGSEIRYETLVFADGALSRAHADFSLRREGMAFCVEAYFPRELLPVEGLELCLGIVPKGYVWVFPHGERVCAGLINVHRKGYPYVETLKRFLERRGVPTEGIEFRGAFVPYGVAVPQKRLPENVFLVGDAGGFADPITGEGLYMALLSGKLAGEAMAARSPKRAFLEGMGPAIKMIRSGRKLQTIVFKPLVMKKVMEKMKGRDPFLGFYCDQLISEYRYQYTDASIVQDYKRLRGED